MDLIILQVEIAKGIFEGYEKLVVTYTAPVTGGKPKMGGDGYSTGKVKLGG